MSTTSPDLSYVPQIARWQRIAYIVGGVGLAVCALSAINEELREQFFRSYLWAFVFCIGVPLGCLAVVLIQHLTGGDWGYALKRLLEAATRTLPVLAVLFIPLTLGLSSLYVWAQPDIVKHDEDLQWKALYLNVPFFIGRAVFYFAAWIGLSTVINVWSARSDQVSSPSLGRRLRAGSGFGLALYGLTMTFASIDWMMSLEPHWYSTIYGPMIGIGQVLEGFAFTLIVALLLRDHSELKTVLTRPTMRDCGNLLLAFVMVWAYLSFSQFLLIWSGNLPEEAPWYLRRIEGGWAFVAMALFALHFVTPFILLLSRNTKQQPGRLMAVACLLVVMAGVNLLWLTRPAFAVWSEHSESQVTPGVHFLDAAALAGVWGIWLGSYLGQLSKRPLVPEFAMDRDEGEHHG